MMLLDELIKHAKEVLFSGDSNGIHQVAQELLTIAGKDEKRKADEPPQDSPEAKRSAQIAEAQALARTMTASANLIALSSLVPQLVEGSPKPTVGSFMGALRAYVEVYANFREERHLARRGAGIYLRNNIAVSDGNGVYTCDVFTPAFNTTFNIAGLVYRHAQIDSVGNILQSTDEEQFVTFEDAFSKISAVLLDEDRIFSLSVALNFAHAGADALTINELGNQNLNINLDFISLNRIMYATNFLDSKATLDASARVVTARDKMVRLFEAVARDDANFAQGEEYMATFRTILIDGLKEMGAATFGVRVAGGGGSRRSFSISVENNTIVVRRPVSGTIVVFDDFFRSAFPRQVFVQTAPNAITSFNDDDDVDNEAIVENDFQNTRFGRDLTIRFFIGGVRNVDDIKLTLKPVTTATATVAEPRLEQPQSVVHATHVEPANQKAAAETFRSAGVHTTRNGKVEAYPAWETLENAMATTADDSQVAGIADDEDDVAVEFADIIGMTVGEAKSVKKAFAMLAGLVAYQTVEQLFSGRFANTMRDIMLLAENNKKVLRLTIKYNAMRDDPVKKRPIINYDSHAKKHGPKAADMKDDITSIAKEKAPVKITVTLKSGSRFQSEIFSGLHIVNSNHFQSQFRDEKNRRVFVGVTRKNGLGYLSTQFPYNPAEELEMTVQEAAQLPTRTSSFMLNGKLYSSVRQFEEQSRFEGFDCDNIFNWSTTTETASEEEERRLCDAVIKAEMTIKTAGAKVLREAFDEDEFQRAVSERIFQNVWIYEKFKTLMAEQPRIEFFLMPRLVRRLDPQIGDYVYTVEQRVSISSSGTKGLFHSAMEKMKINLASHINRATLRKNVGMLRLPCPQVLLNRPTVGNRETTMRVVFIPHDVNDRQSGPLFHSEDFFIGDSRASSLGWANNGTHLAQKPTLKAALARAETKAEKEYPINPTNVLRSYDSMFSLKRNKDQYNTLGELIRKHAEPTVSFFDIGTMGNVTSSRGVPHFSVEVHVTINQRNVVVFRGDVSFSIDELDEYAEVFQVNSTMTPTASTALFPKTLVFLATNDHLSATVSIESYRLIFPKTAAEMIAALRNNQPNLTLPERAELQPAALVRPQIDEILDLTSQESEELEMLEALLANTPPVTVKTEPAVTPPPPAKKARVVIDLEDYVNEGDAAQDEAAKPTQPAPKQPRKAVAVKKPGGVARIALKQTGAALVSAPVHIEISDHGFEQRGVKVGFRERADDALDQTIQAVFLHPTYSDLVRVDGINVERLLDSVARTFTELMPRRSVKVLRAISKAKNKLLDQIATMSRAKQKETAAKIKTLKGSYDEANKEKKKSEAELVKMKNSINVKIERLQGETDKEIEVARLKMVDEFNTEHGIKKKRAPDEDSDMNEALAYFTDKERAFDDMPELAETHFIYNGNLYTLLNKVLELYIPPQSDSPVEADRVMRKQLSAIFRARVMQNRALYLSLLKLSSVVIEKSNQAMLELVPALGKGLPTNEPRATTFGTLRYKLISDKFEPTKVVSKVGGERVLMRVFTSRVRLGGALLPKNVEFSVKMMSTDRVNTLIGTRIAFFARTSTLRHVELLLSPITVTVVESLPETTTAVEQGEAEEKEEEEGEEGAAVVGTTLGKPSRTVKKKELSLTPEAVSAAAKLLDLDLVNVDFCIAQDNDTTYGLLIGGFVDRPEKKTHSYEVLALDAVDDEVVEQLLDYAEHAIKYVDVAQGSGRKESSAVGVDVIEKGFTNYGQPGRTAAVKRVLTTRGYINVDVSGESIWMLSVDRIRDRVHYLANTLFGQLHLGWIENDIVTQEEWDHGQGRTFPLVVRGERRNKVVKDEKTGEQHTEEIRVWREAPHPFFIPEKPDYSLQAKLIEADPDFAVTASADPTANQIVDPSTFLVVKCYLVTDDGTERKLIYVSESAPDWIKLNGEIALLPFTSNFAAFVRDNPEVVVERVVERAEGERQLVVYEKYRLETDLETLLDVIKKRRIDEKLSGPGEAALVGATDQERQAVSDLRDAIEDLKDGIQTINDDELRKEKSLLLNYNPNTQIDWGLNQYLFEIAKVQYTEPRFTTSVNTHEIGTVGSLNNLWARTASWVRPGGFNATTPLNRQYNLAVLQQARALNTPSWRTRLLERAEKNRWRAFMSKHTSPQPYTKLRTMLVLARDSGKRIQFEVEEHTLCGNEIAPPRVVFTSSKIKISQLFDETLAYSTRMRLRRDAKGEIDEAHANEKTSTGETLDEFDPEEEMLVRSVRLENKVVIDDIEESSNLYPAGVYRATIRRANTVNYLDIELNNNIDEDDDVPERVVLGAFFIGTTPNNVEVATIVEDAESISRLRAEVAEANQKAIVKEHSQKAGGGDSSDSEDDEDFLGSEEESESEESASESESMPVDQLARILAAL